MNSKAVWLWSLKQAPVLLFFAVFALFGSLSRQFLEVQNLVNILIQSSSIAVAAMGMTLVLLTAGVDLSVGSVMFVAVAVTGKLIYQEQPLALALAGGLFVGVAAGLINALLITRLRVIAFIATLGMLFVARGFGLWLTSTRAMNMPESITQLGNFRWFGFPLPVLLMLLAGVVLHLLLTRTVWGRQVYAVGNDVQAAKRAGIRVSTILCSVYVLCGVCAALGGLIALTQIGAVSPSFGQQKEFAAIAAAVLGGTSLFGGRGNILPGTLFGAILFQTVENGLVIINADPYLYSLILSAIIFLAVLLDTTRVRLVDRLSQRTIRAVH